VESVVCEEVCRNPQFQKGTLISSRDGLGQAEMIQLITPPGNYLVLIDPDVAISRQHVDMSFGLPVCMSLAAVWITKGDVYAREFLVLQQYADHLR
jgi:hypothetical protein